MTLKQAFGFVVLQRDRFSAGIKADAGFLLTVNVVLASRAVVPEFGVMAPRQGHPYGGACAHLEAGL